MKESTYKKIFTHILEFLKQKPEGARYSEIIAYLKSQLRDVPNNTIHRATCSFKQKIINGEIKTVTIPEKGLYLHSEYQKAKLPPPETQPEEIRKKETDFYKKFAEYLVNGLEECTKAIPLGGNKFQDRWGTPDVLGVYKFSEADPIRPPLEIVSAEIKTDIAQLITAFGQSCAYKIFSHKVYLVIPKQAESEIPRLESLCLRFGIGLILFDRDNLNNPQFQIRTRALKSEPDYFYVNQYIKKLSKNDIRELLV